MLRVLKSRSFCRFLSNNNASAMSVINGESNFENIVGITSFVNSQQGFQGILKQRFNDFIVREIDKSGNIAKLDFVTVPKSISELEEKYFKLSNSGVDNIVSVLTKIQDAGVTLMSSVEDTSNFFEMCINKHADCPPSMLLASCTDKAQRSAVHIAIKSNFAAFIDSDTVTEQNTSCVRIIAKHIQKKNNRKEPNSRDSSSIAIRTASWPSALGQHIKFTLAKENVDTISAISMIARNLNIDPDYITYAGTKDKRGVTFQACTIFKRKPSTLVTLNNISRMPLIRVGDFSFVDKAIRLGDLTGNNFTIVLRQIEPAANTNSINNAANTASSAAMKTIVTDACNAMKKHGFINYFGLQRFGKGVTKSHLIGREIIKGNYQSCCDCFFDKAPDTSNEETPAIGTTTDREVDKQSFQFRSDVSHISQAYYQHQYAAALESCSYKMYAEKKILESLVAYPTDFPRAFHAVPKHLRSLCLHAYQSYLWNHVASRRVSLSLEVMPGDLVIVSGILEEDLGEDAGMDGEAVPLTSTGTATASAADTPAAKAVEVHVVTAQDIQDRTYSITDVVIPLLGQSSVVTPLYQPWFEALLIPDGLSVAAITSNTLTNLQGGYRKLIQAPKDFSYQVLEYNDANADLYETELVTFGGTKSNAAAAGASAGNTIGTEAGSKYVGLLLQFSLSSGCYATMMLRELMKQGTDSIFHAKMTQDESHRKEMESGQQEDSRNRDSPTPMLKKARVDV